MYINSIAEQQELFSYLSVYIQECERNEIYILITDSKIAF
jgi:hypothetical protein